MRRWIKSSKLAVLASVSACTLLVGCAQVTQPSAQDPYESFNRSMFVFNQKMDSIVLKPVTKAYRFVVPKPGREAVNNVLTNLAAPAQVINYTLQGQLEKTLVSTLRFLLNLTFGLGGTIDIATHLGIPNHSTDMGETLARWGVPEGHYVVLPFLGPTTTRAMWEYPLDFGANVGTVLLWHEPLAARAAFGASRVVNLRNNLMDSGADDLLKDAFDEYVAVRNAYLQHRQYQLEQRGIVNHKDDDNGLAGLPPLELDQ